MPLTDLLHEEYEADGDLVLFRCSECGYTSLSLGSLHAHVEGHWSFLGWFKWHWWNVWRSDESKWMDHTEILRVDEAEAISLEEVEGL
jgi:hypothetical protein